MILFVRHLNRLLKPFAEYLDELLGIFLNEVDQSAVVFHVFVELIEVVIMGLNADNSRHYLLKRLVNTFIFFHTVLGVFLIGDLQDYDEEFVELKPLIQTEGREYALALLSVMVYEFYEAEKHIGVRQQLIEFDKVHDVLQSDHILIPFLRFLLVQNRVLEEDLVEFEHIVVYDFLDVLLDIFV